jgi:hypothetical protein
MLPFAAVVVAYPLTHTLPDALSWVVLAPEEKVWSAVNVFAITVDAPFAATHAPLTAKQPLVRLKPLEAVEVALVPVRLRYVPWIPVKVEVPEPLTVSNPPVVILVEMVVDADTVRKTANVAINVTRLNGKIRLTKFLSTSIGLINLDLIILNIVLMIHCEPKNAPDAVDN